MQQYLCLLLAGLTMAACASDSGGASAASPVAAAASGCIAGGSGALQAQLRGALTADLDWRNEVMLCEGGARPDGKGLRVTLAGPLPAVAEAPPAGPTTAGASPTGSPHGTPRLLRFIFGIDYADAAAGTAQALPTNITVILEGEGRMFATRGNERCAVEKLERAPLDGQSTGFERVHVRGYCTEPATDLAGDARLLVPTFEFTGRVATGETP